MKIRTSYPASFPFLATRSNAFFFDRQDFEAKEAKRNPSYKPSNTQQQQPLIPWVPNNAAEAAHTGIATHLAIRLFFTKERKGEIKDVLESREVREKIPHANIRTALRYLQAFKEAWCKMEAKGWTWVASEVSFESDLRPLFAFDDAKTWRYKGQVDLILRDPKGCLSVWDIKTTSRDPESALEDAILPLMVYRGLVKKAYKEEVAFGGCFVFTPYGFLSPVLPLTEEQVKDKYRDGKAALVSYLEGKRAKITTP